MAKRTDCHRPGAIIPAHYRYVMSYHLATTDGSWPVPPFNVDKVMALRASGAKFAATGGLGQCSVCRTHYIYGDVWVHELSGEHIHIGQDCARKYELLADYSEFELEAGRHRAAAAREVQKKLNREAREAFLDAHPGLVEALEVNHPIIADIARKFQRDLSDKQVALVLKLADEVKNPRPAETRVDAPVGKARFRGRVVSVKVHDSFYGEQLKMTVKVQTPEGVWLAWGTAPSGLLSDTVNHDGALRGVSGGPGTEVEISCTLVAGRERGFAIMKRPRGRVVTRACGGAGNCRECERLAAETAPTAKQATLDNAASVR